MANETHTPQRLKKMRKRKAKPFATVITTGLSVSSGLMLGFAVPNLIGADSGLDFAKAILLAGSGALVSLGVNRLAVEKGALQAAIGTAGATLVSTVSMLAVGAGLFAATYAGLVIKDVDALRQQEFGTEYAEFIDLRNQKAIEAGRAAPVMRAIVSDLTAKEACESETSCISGRGNGGVGRVSRALSEERQRAESIASQVEAGDIGRRSALDRLNTLLAEYQNILGDGELTDTERRKKLQANVALAGQAISDLNEAVPTALLSAFVSELRSGVSIPGRADTTRKMNALLAGYADSLNTVLNSVERGSNTRPSFPAKAGVSDTFAYMGHFLPIAAIVAVVELIFPLTLWLYTYFTLVGRVYRDDPPEDDKGPDAGSFSGLVAMPPIKLAPEPDNRPRRTSHGSAKSQHRTRR